MPHLYLEHTGDIPESFVSRYLLLELHHLVHCRLGVPASNCKGRILRRDLYVVGDGLCAQSFVHLRVRFLTGRSLAQRLDLGQALLGHLKLALEGTGLDPQITVSVVELDRGLYFKHPPGTLSSPWSSDQDTEEVPGG